MSAPRRTALFTLALALALAALGARPALAQQPEDPAGMPRRSLLTEAAAARAAGDHPRALEYARRAFALQPSPSVQLFIAEEQLALGRHAEAYSNARVCTAEATRDQALRNRDAILAACARIETESSAHVGFVRVQPPDGVEGLEARANDALVPRALWNVPYPVNAGSVLLEIRRGDALLFSERFAVNVRETTSLHVAASQLREGTATARVSPVAPAVTPPAGPGAAPWVLFGSGLGAAALGGALYGVAFALPIAPTCAEGVEPSHPQSCTRPEVLTAEAGPRALATAGIVVMSLGGVSAAAGLVWALVAPPRRPLGRERERASVEPALAGLRVRW